MRIYVVDTDYNSAAVCKMVAYWWFVPKKYILRISVAKSAKLLFCNGYFKFVKIGYYPYPEPVYTGWSSVHWNAIGMPLAEPVHTGIPLEKLSWNSPTLECHCRNLVQSAPHWDATGETLTFAAYTGTPLEGLWQPTHAPTHIVKHAE